MNTKELKDRSRYLSLLLRHQPEKENLVLDKNGYVEVDDLLNKLNLTYEELEWIVQNNDKKRFSFNEDNTKIKANQGHSVEVKLEAKKVAPPNILYHGTSIANKDAILDSGLKRMSRHHVHLTNDKNTAYNVGLRYAKYQNKVWMIAIDAKKMYNDGYEFFVTENNVFLTDHVPSKYFIE